ncbi:glycine cleavage system protein GcvH [Gordonia sp. HY002]|uniref:glycine cleavage system protein GcvH n=1 Tax=Gordonia zhenghanii TaxID=2911516 RepID=UPI001EF0A457|nr:glycine cleavage system protein GcvH [Gordonia zhenghanii]MCF8571794.1 glycine cleavage system protein GcvH [Gordonia zhenghanii]MCF8604806.1 glycine cleavage system protein GcvH [Gordonia zhenghanii]
MSDTKIPENLRYTADHEWVSKVGDKTVRVGITDFAQDALGDVVFVQLPDVDDAVQTGESFAEVESTKSVSDIFGPLDGTIAAANDALEGAPELVNSSPYDDGWLVEITVADDVDLDAVLADLLDAAGYAAAVGS